MIKSKSENNVKRLDSLQRSARNIKILIDNNLEFNDLILTLTFKENMQDYDKSDKGFPQYFIERKLKSNTVILNISALRNYKKEVLYIIMLSYLLMVK